MTLTTFTETADFANLSELEKAIHLAFFYLKTAAVHEFGAVDCAGWIHGAGFSRPNVTRLDKRLGESGDTIRGSRAGYFRLHNTRLKQLEQTFAALIEKPQTVQDHGTILPPVVYEKTRGVIESLSKQINRSYEDNIFDGCAVLMRRLEEVLLIMAYEHLKIADAIKDQNGHYLLLEGIVSNAATNGTLNLSRNSRTSIEVFRKLGNYSAHKIHYTCKREYIKEKIDEYRALIDELLHKADLRK